MTLQKKIEASRKLYRELMATMNSLEEQLSSLNLQQMLIAVKNLERLHHQMEAADLELLQTLPTVESNDRIIPLELLEEHRAMLIELVERNKRVLPRLQTRLTACRTELAQIKNGIATMQGYQTHPNSLGRHINTAN